MKTEISKNDSLNIINEMIAEARNNFYTRNTRTMELMGYATITIAILNIVLLQVLETPSYSYFVWLLMIPVSLINSIVSSKNKKEAVVVTHIDRIIESVWSAFAICNTIFLITLFTWAYMEHYWLLTVLIMPVILLLIALALFTTGVACKFQPYKRGGYIFALGAIVCIFALLFTSHYEVIQFVILIVCMVLGFILPSIQLKKIAKQNV